MRKEYISILFVGCLAVLGLIGLAGWTHAGGDQDEKAKAEIIAVVDKFNQAINAGDVPGSVSVYAQEAESFPLFDMKFASMDQRVAAAQKAVDSGVKVNTKRNNDMKIKIIGNTAWAHWTWLSSSELPDGRKSQTAGRTTFILEKREGEWKVVHSHISVPFSPGGPRREP